MELSPSATCGVLVRHPVAAYDKFRAAFDAHAPMRTAAGMVGWSCNTVAGDDTDILAYVQGDDLGKVRAFVGDPGLKSAMGDAGVTGPPTFTFLNHVEMARYS